MKTYKLFKAKAIAEAIRDNQVVVAAIMVGNTFAPQEFRIVEVDFQQRKYTFQDPKTGIKFDDFCRPDDSRVIGIVYGEEPQDSIIRQIQLIEGVVARIKSREADNPHAIRTLSRHYNQLAYLYKELAEFV